VEVSSEHTIAGIEWERRYSSTLSLTLVLSWGGWLRTRPDRFTPGNESVPVVWVAGRAAGPV